MAQRLSRKLCNHCKREVPILGEDKRIIELILKYIPRKEDIPHIKGTMYEPVGCEKCGGTGYKGRIALVEAIQMDPKVEEVLRSNPTEIEIWRASRHQKMRRMYEDGILKVLDGTTSLEELRRVVDLNEEEIIAIGEPQRKVATTPSATPKPQVKNKVSTPYKKPVSYSGADSSSL